MGTAAIGSTAQAEVIGGSVPANHNVTVFANIDMVAVFGGAPGAATTVEVLRSGKRIGTATGSAADLGEFGPPNNGGMEVNHGPAGAPAPGDCWENFTPDIVAGDIVRVTRGADVEEVRVDDIEIYGMAVPGPNGEIHLKGRAALADGTPIPVAALDSGEVRQPTPRYRANPTRVVRTAGTTDGWTAIYDPPYTPFSETTPLSQDERRSALLNNEHAMGYGHVAPLPAETQLSDGLEGSGPALGCEASAGQSNAVASASDPSINVASGDLTVSGTSMAGGVTAGGALDPGTDITGATITASDGVNSISAPATGDFDGPGAWDVNFTRAQLDTLADGPIVVTGAWAAGGGDPLGGKKLTIQKDVVAPVLTATPSPGTSTGATSVALSAGPGEAITYRTDGQPQTNNDLPYTGPISLPVGTTVLSVRVRDAAGNVTDQSLTYRVNAPASGGGGSSTPAPAPIVAPPLQNLAAPSSNAPALTAFAQRSLRVRLASVKRRGLNAAFTAPAGANDALARLYRLKGSKRKLVSSKRMKVTGGRRHVARFAGRKLKAGKYHVVLRVGSSAASLGKATTIVVTVVR